MTLKLSTIIVAFAITAGTITAICVGIRRNSLAPQDPLPVGSEKTAMHCRYMYDEMAHKLVAYSAMERCAANQRTFSSKLGSRILQLTKDAQSETQIMTL